MPSGTSMGWGCLERYGAVTEESVTTINNKIKWYEIQQTIKT
jgi:hypothetical protein